MKKSTFVVLLLCLTTILAAFSGHISENITWSEDFTLTGDTWVDEGVTLTIMPGVTISIPKIDQDNNGIGDINFYINGRVISQGTSANPVIFTSNQEVPAHGDWAGITLNAPSAGTISNLNHTYIRYADKGFSINGRNVTLNNCKIEHSKSYGMRIEDSIESTSLNNLLISDCLGYGMNIESGLVSINYANIVDCGTYGVKVFDGTTVTGNNVTVAQCEDEGFYIHDTDSFDLNDVRSISNGGIGFRVESGIVDIENAVIANNDSHGISVNNSTSDVTFSYSEISENGVFGCNATNQANLEILYSTIINNIGSALMISTEANVTANYNNIYNNNIGSVTFEDSETIPSSQLYLSSTGNSSFYTTRYPLNYITSVHVSGYADHNSSSDDYYFYVHNGSGTTIYSYQRPNTSYDTSFDSWVTLSNPGTSNQLRVSLSQYSVYSYWGRLSAIEYEIPIEGYQITNTNASAIADLEHNWWGSVNGVDAMVYQTNDGFTNYANLAVANIDEATSSLSNFEPEIAIEAPSELTLNPTTVNITWSDLDLDNDATVSLYYQLIGSDERILITENISEDNNSDSFNWNVSTVEYGLYKIIAEIYDAGSDTTVTDETDYIIQVGPLTGNVSDQLQVASNSEIVVPVQLLNAYSHYDITAFQFTLTYDPNLITVNSIDNIASLSENWSIFSNTTVPGEIAVNGFASEAFSVPGDLVYVTLQVAEGASNFATTPLTFTEFIVNDGSQSVTTSNGLITVKNQYNISGSVSYYNDEATPIEGAIINLSGDNDGLFTADVNGEYLFENQFAGDYSLESSIDAEIGELTITPYDASLVARFAIGLETFTSLQQTAGDVNNDGNATIYDASLIAQYSVQLIDSFEAGDWLINPNTYNFTLGIDNATKDFSALVVGDPSKNWTPVARNTEEMVVDISSLLNGTTGIVEIPVYASNEFSSLYGNIAYNSSKIDILGINRSALVEDFAHNDNSREGSLLFSSFGTQQVASNEAIYTISIEINEAINVNDLRISSLLFDEEFANVAVTANADDINPVTSFSVSQNYPNPFNPETNIIFNLKESANVEVTVYNVKGQKVTQIADREFQAGRNQVTWNAEGFASGIYYYKVTTENGSSKLKKMVLLK